MKKNDFVKIFGGDGIVERVLEVGGARNILTGIRYYYNTRTRRDWMVYMNAGRSFLRYRNLWSNSNKIEPKVLSRNKQRVKQGLAYLLEANAVKCETNKRKHYEEVKKS